MSHPLGFDIGKNTVHVAQAIPGQTPKKWPVHVLDLTGSTWSAELEALAVGAPVAALEPTGWYYSRPLVSFLIAHGIQVLEVAHNTTAHMRQVQISRQKTDATDARALAAIAAQAASTAALPIGCRLVDLDALDLNIELRLLLNSHRRAVRAATAGKNRLAAFAYGLWPTLSASGAYRRAILAGAVTPDELRALLENLESPTFSKSRDLADLYPDGRAVRYLRDLVRSLPAVIPPAPRLLRDQIQAAALDIQHWSAAAATIEAEIEALCWSDPLADITGLWTTVPAYSLLAVATLHAAAHCHADQFTPDQFRAAVGSHPSRQESGQVTESRDNKRGYRPAKTQLHLWTLRLLSEENRPNPIADYFDKLKDAGNPNAVHAARGKLARVLAGIARAGRACDWPAPPGVE